MPEKSPKRLKLEQSLAEDPGDRFLQYGLALQCLREGDLEEGRERLKSLIAEDPEHQVAAYQQLGQSYAENGELEPARSILQRGIGAAKAAGDHHAAAEMEQLIVTLV